MSAQLSRRRQYSENTYRHFREQACLTISFSFSTFCLQAFYSALLNCHSFCLQRHIGSSDNNEVRNGYLISSLIVEEWATSWGFGKTTLLWIMLKVEGNECNNCAIHPSYLDAHILISCTRLSNSLVVCYSWQVSVMHGACEAWKLPKQTFRVERSTSLGSWVHLLGELVFRGEEAQSLLRICSCGIEVSLQPIQAILQAIIKVIRYNYILNLVTWHSGSLTATQSLKLSGLPCDGGRADLICWSSLLLSFLCFLFLKWMRRVDLNSSAFIPSFYPADFVLCLAESLTPLPSHTLPERPRLALSDTPLLSPAAKRHSWEAKFLCRTAQCRQGGYYDLKSTFCMLTSDWLLWCSKDEWEGAILWRPAMRLHGNTWSPWHVNVANMMWRISDHQLHFDLLPFFLLEALIKQKYCILQSHTSSSRSADTDLIYKFVLQILQLPGSCLPEAKCTGH